MPAFAVLHTTPLFTVKRCRRRVITPTPHLIHTQKGIYGIFSYEAVQGDELSLWLNVVKTETNKLKKKKKKPLWHFQHTIFALRSFFLFGSFVTFYSLCPFHVLSLIDHVINFRPFFRNFRHKNYFGTVEED